MIGHTTELIYLKAHEKISADEKKFCRVYFSDWCSLNILIFDRSTEMKVPDLSGVIHNLLGA